MSNFDYKNLTPFKWFVLENFPFIEADFDALSEWQLFCKLGKELNKLINSTNTLGTQVEDLTNYFNNLDVQDEIDNKLNEMAESGELEEIIAQYLQLAGLLCFNTVNDMKNATNLINGSFVKTFGLNEYNDGKGEFYKIRNITSSDIVDNYKIIALNNSNVLIAELIETAKKRCILIGDSYSVGVSATNNKGWSAYTKELLEANGYSVTVINENGAGFIRQGQNLHTFKTLLESNLSNILNKQYVDKIVVAGGCNDYLYTANVIEPAIEEFINFCKTNFINSKVYVGMIGNFSKEISGWKFALYNNVLPAYINCNKYGGIYLSGTENLNKKYSLFDVDNTHLLNYEAIGCGIFNILENKNMTKYNSYTKSTTNNTNLSKQIEMYTMQQDNIVNILIPNQSMINLTTPATGNVLNLGKIELENYRSSDGFILSIPCEIAVILQDANVYYSNANITINNDNELLLAIQNVTTFDNIVTLAFAGTSFTLPTIYC